MNEEMVEQAVTLKELRGLSTPVVAGIGLAALATGGVLGYILAVRRLKPKYEDLASKEIAEARDFYNRLNREDLVFPVKPSLEEAARALQNYRGEEIDDEPEVEVLVETQNVFDASNTDDMFDLEAEIEKRKFLKPDEPYIISHDEFTQNETEFDQTTLTWYDGDMVLADERDTPIDEVDITVGEANMRMFGHGSGNSSTVFVRNTRLKLEFEIVKSDGHFAYEVLGLEHSDEPSLYERRNRIHKFRGDRE